MDSFDWITDSNNYRQANGMDTGGNDWGSWFQDIAGGVVKGVTQVHLQQNQQQYEVEKLRMQALGQLGPYTEGQANAFGGTNSSTLLLLGFGLVLVLMLKD